MAKQIKKGEIDCTNRIMAVQDAIDILNGRWKIFITSLHYRKMKFMELQREVASISGKMLSGELQNLEFNKLITRNSSYDEGSYIVRGTSIGIFLPYCRTKARKLARRKLY